MNKVIVGQEQKGYDLIKDFFFNILSLNNQLYQSWSTTLESSQLGKIYFSLNPMPDLFTGKIKILSANIKAYNLFLDKNEIFSTKIIDQPGSSLENLMDLDINSNKKVNKLFNVAKIATNITFNLVIINLWIVGTFYNITLIFFIDILSTTFADIWTFYLLSLINFICIGGGGVGLWAWKSVLVEPETFWSLVWKLFAQALVANYVLDFASKSIACMK